MSFLNDRPRPIRFLDRRESEGDNLSETPLAGMRILVMEDEYLIAMDVEQICRDHGAEDVLIVRNLVEFERDPGAMEEFHAAVIDVMLSGVPTLDFARRLRERGVPFVFATGFSKGEEMFAHFPEVQVVGKPYSAGALIAAMAAAIASSKEISGGV